MVWHLNSAKTVVVKLGPIIEGGVGKKEVRTQRHSDRRIVPMTLLSLFSNVGSEKVTSVDTMQRSQPPDRP
jgi:hypothetical protein